MMKIASKFLIFASKLLIFRTPLMKLPRRLSLVKRPKSIFPLKKNLENISGNYLARCDE